MHLRIRDPGLVRGPDDGMEDRVVGQADPMWREVAEGNFVPCIYFSYSLASSSDPAIA